VRGQPRVGGNEYVAHNWNRQVKLLGGRTLEWVRKITTPARGETQDNTIMGGRENTKGRHLPRKIVGHSKKTGKKRNQKENSRRLGHGMDPKKVVVLCKATSWGVGLKNDSIKAETRFRWKNLQTRVKRVGENGSDLSNLTREGSWDTGVF